MHTTNYEKKRAEQIITMCARRTVYTVVLRVLKIYWNRSTVFQTPN